jgi:acetyltransferase-like isoleucine patch superfamily enzyme
LHINDKSRPLVFLGSNYVMYKFSELCEEHGIEIAGIVDKDYWGNTDKICDIPVIGSEDDLSDFQNLNFFCATNWTPMSGPVAERNKSKRSQLIDIIQKQNLNCVSLVDPTARISRRATVGKNVFIDAHVLIESGVQIGDFSSLYGRVQVGHDTVIKQNCVLQRDAGLASAQLLEENVFFGCGVRALKPDVTFGKDSFIHELVYIKRGTVPGEIVSFNQYNTKRVERPYRSEYCDIQES